MPRMTIDLPEDVLDKLAIVVQHQSAWPATPNSFNIEDLIATVVTDYAREQVGDTGKINPDLRNEGSPVVRLTNGILVLAIDNGILELEVPPRDGSPLASILESLYHEIVSPRGQAIFQHCVRRLAIMTTPITGSIRVMHGAEHYTIFVEFDKTADSQDRIRIKITRSNGSE